MNEYDSTADTLDHIRKVQGNLYDVTYALLFRSKAHDKSKLEPEEKETFDRVTPKLRGLTYGSDEYKACIAEMGEALKHHYAVNPHHPEHYDDGIAGMSLLDVVEMFCDWRAASQRHTDGDFAKSLEINRKRFAISDQLASIFENTRLELGW
jgi:hypothetical protein